MPSRILLFDADAVAGCNVLPAAIVLRRCGRAQALQAAFEAVRCQGRWLVRVGLMQRTSY